MVKLWSYRETSNWEDIPCGEPLTSQFVCQKYISIMAQCGEHQYQCASGECIYSVYVCDNNPDCFDHSDELNCSHIQDRSCSEDHFACDDGTCIHSTFYCDFIYHCEDKSDESECVSAKESFQCFSGRFLPASRKCDGHRDCSGRQGEDEPQECGLLFCQGLAPSITVWHQTITTALSGLTSAMVRSTEHAYLSPRFVMEYPIVLKEMMNVIVVRG
ncbi:Low-density lipoprotein receptor-related protein 8 [Holothuria leucospilota]|uniref:Low-density lipoprotein receptor-related protein 8 n=1 Tax=Holothuria leucospilota TaxID=206669 RepID=A0A9Q0YRB3_HOLLE|nr:Low-density lipoprotein receptor-related protein 8 [Holothuria leucospilota]